MAIEYSCCSTSSLPDESSARASVERAPSPPTESPPDLATLRLAYTEMVRRMDITTDRTKHIAAEFSALPPAAGAVLAIFFAALPKEAPMSIRVLVLLGLFTFVIISWMCTRAIRRLEAPELQVQAASQYPVAHELQPDDGLNETEWLRQRVIGWRLGATLGAKRNASYAQHLSTVRYWFFFHVLLLGVITAVALLVAD